MTGNYSELLGNIASKAPWLIDKRETYAPTTIKENPRQVIDDIRNHHLTIIADNGRVYRQYLTITIENGKMYIDRPFKWIDSTVSFHVFFLNNDDNWHFFEVDNAQSGVINISSRIPDKIYSLLRRRHRRVSVPSGTKVIFKNDNNLIDIMHVKNISEGGMLICDNSSVNKYPVNSKVNEIFLSIPPNNKSEGASPNHRVLPYITRGKVVRSYMDPDSSTSHYGISFQHENHSLTKRFKQVVSDFENLPG